MEENHLWIWRTIDGIVSISKRVVVATELLIERVYQNDCDLLLWTNGEALRLPENRHFCGKDSTFPIEATDSTIAKRCLQDMKI